MADIFVSYKKEDAGRVIRLVEALRAEGFSVWWDHGIHAGAEWDRTIREELDAARVVVAVWSASSVNAPWVKEEAGVGKSRGILLPVRIDDVEPPLGFTLIQAADLVGWRGDRKDPRWAFLIEAARRILSGERAAAVLEAPLRGRRNERPAVSRLAAAGLAVLLLLAGGAGLSWFLLRDSPPTEAPAAAQSPAPPARPSPSAGEQQLWDRAMEEKSRQGFQTYLVAYPDGAYAQRARDILLTCRAETREEWRPGPAVANQIVRGVSSGHSRERTQGEACSAAKSDVHDRAKMMCETIVHNGGFRNARWTVTDRPCDCSQSNPQVTVCIADLPYSCMWDQKVAERIELCG